MEKRSTTGRQAGEASWLRVGAVAGGMLVAIVLALVLGGSLLGRWGDVRASREAVSGALDRTEDEFAQGARERLRKLERENAELEQQLEAEQKKREAERQERYGGRPMRDMSAKDAEVIARSLGITADEVRASSPVELEVIRRQNEGRAEIEKLQKEVERLQVLAAQGGARGAASASSAEPAPRPSPLPPEATIAGPDSTKADHEVTFEAKNLRGNIQKFTWRMGDGTELTGNPVKYKYVNLSSFTVRLTVEDEQGRMFEAQKQVEVK